MITDMKESLKRAHPKGIKRRFYADQNRLLTPVFVMLVHPWMRYFAIIVLHGDFDQATN